MMKWKTGLGLAAMLMMVGNVHADPYIESFENGTMNWDNGTMQATGIGAPPERYLNNPSRARPMAIRAAKLDALRNLMEQVQGVNVTSHTLTKDFAVESDLIRTTKQGLVKSAVMVGKPHYMEDGSVEVNMAINYRKEVAPLVMNAYKQSSAKVKETVPEAQPLIETVAEPAKEDVKASAVSGLIIDAVGLGLRTALAPKILDEAGNVVYSGNVVTEEKQSDMVAYDTSAQDAAKLDRVGTNPVTIKAVKVIDRTDVVISNEDAANLIKQAGVHDVLRNAHVVFAL